MDAAQQLENAHAGANLIYAFFGVVIAFAVPIIFSRSNTQRTATTLAVILTILSFLIIVSSRDLSGTILGVGAWIGAMIAGLAGYLRSAMVMVSRNHAFRVINNYAAGLE